MVIEHKGYRIEQNDYNNHIMMCKDDRMVLHVNCTEKRTEQQLRGLVDGYIKFLESGDMVDIFQE